MTDQRAALSATFEDFKLIKSRKSCQIILEVALEHADRALEVLGGVPRPDQPVHVALARIKAPAKEDRPKRTWEELTPAEQAGVRCADDAFREWLSDLELVTVPPWLQGTEEGRAHIAQFVRDHCGVQSRSDLNTNPEAAQRWRELDMRYQEETGRVAKRMG